MCKNEHKGPVLALDIGEIRIGIAISDPLRIIAQPLDVLERKSLKDDMSKIESWVSEREIQLILVGHPLNLRGKRTKSTYRALEFADRIRNQPWSPEIKLWDERFSTAQAESALLEGNVSRKNRKQKIDQVAAALILQNYLDSNRKI